MTLAGYDRFCAGLPHASQVVQWGGAHVWKVAGKVFAIATEEGGRLAVTFKCSPLTFDLLKDRPGVRPAPYLASRGLIWLQRTSKATIGDDALCDYLRESHRLVAAGLPRKTQKDLGLGG